MSLYSSITIDNSFNIQFTIYGIIQENDINNVITNYNNTYSTTYNITNVTDANIGTSTCEIGIKAFKNFTSLESIQLAPSVITINDKAFYNCTSLTSVTMSNNLKNIGYKAFYNCTSLQSIILSNSLTNIGDYAFAYDSSFNNITLLDTSNLTCIGQNLFLNVSPDGSYNFGTHNNFKTVQVEDLISQLPIGWNNVGSEYVTYVDFAVIYDSTVPSCLENSTSYVDLSSVNISWKDFHNLFFINNSYFSLNKNLLYQPNLISPSTLASYSVLNNQVDVYDNSFNLLETVENIYEEKLPRNLWSVESSLCFYKNIAGLKTIFNFQVDRQKLICKKNPNLYNNICQPNCIKQCNNETKISKCKKDSICDKNNTNIIIYNNENTINNNTNTNTISQCDLIYNKTNYKTSYIKGCSLITIDQFFDLFEAQGVQIASENKISPNLMAKGLPINGETVKYAAILNIFLKSCNKCVNNLNIRFPYLIDFSDSMPTSSTDTNNYRYNP